MSPHITRPRPVDVARLGLGIAALIRPEVFLRLTEADDGTGVRRTVQVLGARYVVQSGAGLVLHRRWVPRADAAVDVIHVASMLAIAALAPTHRRLALVSAAAATGFAAADLSEKTRPRGKDPR